MLYKMNIRNRFKTLFYMYNCTNNGLNLKPTLCII